MNEQLVGTQPAPVVQPNTVPAVIVPQSIAADPQNIVTDPASRREAPRAVRFTAYPNFVVVWPVIVLGFLFSLLHGPMGDQYPERVASTLWLLSLFAVMIALGFDLDSSETTFVILAIIVIVLTLQLIAFQWQVPIFSWIAVYLGMLEVRVSSHMMFVVSVLLTVPYLVMLLFCRMNNHWTVAPGKLIRTTFGKNEEEIPINSTKTVNYHFYDMMMRWLCFGAGHLIVSTDKGERKIGHVLWAKQRDADIEPFETMPISAQVK